MAPSEVHSPPTPASIAAATFSSVRRGFDPDEVRAFLRQVAAELARARENEASLAQELEAERRDARDLDEATVAGMLGEETARVLTTAREAARTIKARAEENTERLLRAAQEDATRIREEAQLDAARQRQEAAEEAAATLEAARDEGRGMVNEARAVRERMLNDLQRRRDAARRQLAELDEARRRLLELFSSTQRSVADLLGSLGATPEEEEPADDMEGLLAVGAVAAEPGAEGGPAIAEPVVEGAPTIAEPVVEGAPTVAEPVESVDEPAAAIVAEHDDARHTASEPSDDAESAAMGAVVLSLVVGESEPPVLATGGEPESRDVFRRLREERDEPPEEDRPDDTEPGEIVATEPSLLERRDDALAPVLASLGKRLKRALADEQNLVLDQLRRQGGPTIEGLVGALDAQADPYRRVAEDDLWAAAAAGVRSLAVGLDDDEVAQRLDGARVLDEALASVTANVVEPLREHLERSLSDAAGDSVELASRLRATYREWKTQRFDELCADLALQAYGAGAFAAVEKGTPLQWVGDPSATCPDCDDNALAGTVVAGDAFPTGHHHAPAHPGCRCAITTP